MANQQAALAFLTTISTKTAPTPTKKQAGQRTKGKAKGKGGLVQRKLKFGEEEASDSVPPSIEGPPPPIPQPNISQPLDPPSSSPVLSRSCSPPQPSHSTSLTYTNQAVNLDDPGEPTSSSTSILSSLLSLVPDPSSPRPSITGTQSQSTSQPTPQPTTPHKQSKKKRRFSISREKEESATSTSPTPIPIPGSSFHSSFHSSSSPGIPSSGSGGQEGGLHVIGEDDRQRKEGFIRKKPTHRVWKMPGNADESSSGEPFFPLNEREFEKETRDKDDTHHHHHQADEDSYETEYLEKSKRKKSYGSLEGLRSEGENRCDQPGFEKVGVVFGGDVKLGDDDDGDGESFQRLLPPVLGREKWEKDEKEPPSSPGGFGFSTSGSSGTHPLSSPRYSSFSIAYSRVYFCYSNHPTSTQTPIPSIVYSCNSKVYKKKLKAKTGQNPGEIMGGGQPIVSASGMQSPLLPSQMGMPLLHDSSDFDLARGPNRTQNFLRAEWVQESIQYDQAHDLKPIDGEVEYDPIALDDPRLQKGKHRTVMMLCSCRVSVLPYVKKKEIEEDLNEQFEARHPEIASEIKLTHIRHLKKKMLYFVLIEKLELQTGAYGLIFFEKVIFKRVVLHKGNRKATAAACLYLAIKFVEERATSKTFLCHLLETLAKYFSVSRDVILAEEFPILTALNYGVFLNPKHVTHHLNRMKTTLETKFADPLVEEYVASIGSVKDVDCFSK